MDFFSFLWSRLAFLGATLISQMVHLFTFEIWTASGQSLWSKDFVFPYDNLGQKDTENCLFVDKYNSG